MFVQLFIRFWIFFFTKGGNAVQPTIQFLIVE